MRYLEQVSKGIEYVEANLDSEIPLYEVARHAGLSLWHFQRIFKALTKETLKTYIRSRRLANALEKLLGSDDRIIDIALASGYETQESFTRAFKKAFFMTPDVYRRMGKENQFIKKVRFDEDYITHLHGGITPQPEIAFQAKKPMTGLKTAIFGPDSEKNNMAEKLPPLWHDFLARIDEIKNSVPGQAYGIIQQTGSDTDRLNYYCALETAESAKPPTGMDTCNIPAALYARFEHRGRVKNLDHTVNYIYANWLLTSGYRHSGGPDLEIYGDQYQADSEDSVIHYAIPIEDAGI